MAHGLRLGALALATGVVASGCTGGSALLHPAHVLGEGLTSAGVGLTGTFVGGDAASAIRDARGVAGAGTGATGPASDAQAATYARGAAAAGALGPGVSPWVGARVGLPHASEAGLTYTGHLVRVDARHAFEAEHWALSVGAGASAVLARRGNGDSSELEGLVLEGENGWGLDVPVLVGWRSTSGILSLWAGPRAGWERLGGTVTFRIATPPPGGDVAVTHTWAGGVLGARVGFRHVFAAFELDASAHKLDGSLAGSDVSVRGVSLAPSGALVATF